MPGPVFASSPAGATAQGQFESPSGFRRHVSETGPRRPALAARGGRGLAEQLHLLLVEPEGRRGRVVRPPGGVEHVLHLPGEPRALMQRDASSLPQPRLGLAFFIARAPASRDTAGT